MQQYFRHFVMKQYRVEHHSKRGWRPLAHLLLFAMTTLFTGVVLQLMQQYHYKPVPVGNELSEQIFDRYLDSLDPQKSFLLASDIKEFGKYRRKFDDAIRNSKLNPVFDLFKRFRARVEERAVFATALLQRDFDFTIDETYTFNREEAKWSGQSALR